MRHEGQPSGTEGLPFTKGTTPTISGPPWRYNCRTGLACCRANSRTRPCHLSTRRTACRHPRLVKRPAFGEEVVDRQTVIGNEARAFRCPTVENVPDPITKQPLFSRARFRRSYNSHVSSSLVQVEGLELPGSFPGGNRTLVSAFND